MESRTKIWLGATGALICVMFLSALVLWQSLSVGIGTHGRAAEHCLKTLHADQRDLQAVELALKALGTNAMPTITNMLCFRDSKWRASLRNLLKDQSVVNWKIHTEFDFQNMALAGMERVGEPAGAYVVELFRDAPLRYSAGNPAYRAMKAMLVMGQSGMPALNAGLTNANPFIRAHCALTVGNGINLREAFFVTNLIACMKDPEREVRAAAALAIGRILELPEQSVPALAQGVADDYSSVRFHSIHSLWAFGVHARGVMPQIEAAISRERGLPDEGLDQWELGPKSKEMILYAMTNALDTIRNHVEMPN